MYIFKMIASVGSGAEDIKYLSIFTLFDPNGLIVNDSHALIKITLLLIGAFALYPIGISAFCKKDLHI